ncbi:hypothetical protein HYQ45_003858 [Verticillium longisporum]|uniref:BZIP domain-containing protein n=1 Tax=Verticillium longisporum TaxID=100787 RepID=A0A8I2ZU24_VERLO|nr:hypothetical protein HYQ45_003858 [Verticillium longisporum]
MSTTETEGVQPPAKKAKRGRSQIANSPNASRIRENQRRSRAQRKELVEDLQRKVQEYEQRGIEASLEMQRAARDVAIENSRLRALLAQRGVTNHEIDTHLRYCEDGIPWYNPNQYMASIPFAPSPARTETNSSSSPLHGMTHDQPPLDPLSVLANASTHHDYVSRAFGELKAAATPTKYMAAEHNHATLPAASPHEMSCNAAARIIADMQGHSDDRRARTALGCGASARDCVVKNVTVFRAMEQ